MFPVFNSPSKKKGKYCAVHASDSMVIIEPLTCANRCGSAISKKYNPYCFKCFPNIFPADPRVKHLDTKKQTIMNMLVSKYQDIVTTDIFIKRYACGVLDMGSHVFIFEIDEDDQKYHDDIYSPWVMNIYKHFKERPLLFIRINPDRYTVDSKRQKGCFTRSNEKLVAAKFEIIERVNVIDDTISKNLFKRPIEDISVIYLFHNE
jgi:hypothetical protein